MMGLHWETEDATTGKFEPQPWPWWWPTCLADWLVLALAALFLAAYLTADWWASMLIR